MYSVCFVFFYGVLVTLCGSLGFFFFGMRGFLVLKSNFCLVRGFSVWWFFVGVVRVVVSICLLFLELVGG